LATGLLYFRFDPDSTRRRGGSPDVAITLSYQSVHVDDLLSLAHELISHQPQSRLPIWYMQKYKQELAFQSYLQGEALKEFAQEIGAHPDRIAALYRKISASRLPFFCRPPSRAYW